jgi:hypothetical protein
LARSSELAGDLKVAEEKKSDDVEKFLSEEKALDERKQTLIDDLLKQREAAIAAFDEKLAKLGYHSNSVRGKRSHHKKSASAADGAGKQSAKPKA